MEMKQILLLVDARKKAKDGSARRIRQRAGLTMAEMAEALGVDESSISRWEGGSRQPRTDVAIRWAALLGELDRATSAAA